MNARMQRMRAEALERAKRRLPNGTPDELHEEADEIFTAMCEDMALEQEEGIEDSPCIANCDDAGTGEGRYHGRI